VAGSNSQQKKRVLAGLTFAFALASAAAADARSITVRWRYEEPDRAAGFRVHVGSEPGLYTRTIDVGKPTPDADGVFHATIEVPDHERTFLAVSAYGDRGEESPRSNEGVRAPLAGEAERDAARGLGTPGRPRVVRP
jgi:hypothetical protein